MDSKKTPTATKLLKNIKIAEDFQHRDNWYKNTKRFLSYLIGDWGMAMYSNKYVVNTVYNLINLIIPNLYFQNPSIRLSPTVQYIKRKKKDGTYLSIDAGKAALLSESVLNKELKVIEYEEEVRQIIQDCLIAGIGVMKVGHSPSTSSEEDSDYLDDGDIFAQRVPFFDYFFDPMSTSPDNARFEVYRFVETLESVKKNKDYKNTKDLEGTSLSETNKKKALKEKSKDDTKWVELYEYHDHERNKIYILTKDCGKKKRLLKEMDNPYKFKGSHFIVLKLTGDNDEFRGIAPLSMVEDESLAINEIVSLSLNHLQKFAGIIMYEHGALDEDDLDRFESGEQADMLQTQSGAIAQGRIKRESPLSSGMDYYNNLSTFNGLIDRTLAIPDFSRAPQSGKRKTAYETNLSASESANRRSYYVSFVKKFIIKSTKRVFSLMQQFYDKERWVMIEGDFIDWVGWTREDIEGEYLFDFDVNELKAYNAAQAQATMNALQVMGQTDFFAPLLKQVDPIKLGKKLLNHFEISWPAIKKSSALSHIEQDPYLENQYAFDGKRVPDPHPGENHDEHLTVHDQGLIQAMDAQDEKAYGEISRHVQMTQYAMQILETLPGRPQPQQAQPGQPQQPQGPSQPGQPQPATSEAEVQGSFTYDDQNKENLT